jgi:hypothetical protein
MFTVKIDHESADDLVADVLAEAIDDLEHTSPPNEKELLLALNRVLAYFSVPGSYKDGEYDL